MKNFIVAKLVEVMLGMMNSGTVKIFLDAGFDAIENAVEKSETTLDDKTVLPLIAVIREAVGVPDTGQYADKE